MKVIALIVAAICMCHGLVSAQDKIIGGQGTTVAAHPYIVYLNYDGDQQCAGTLIRPKYVVTAAHCVEGLYADQITVVGGATLISEPGVRREVARIIFPQAYSYETGHMDIAVLRLASPMTGPNISPIGLCSSNWGAGDVVEALGWGQLATGGDYANRLQSVFMPLISKQACQAEYLDILQLTNSMFCTKAPKKGVCAADDGGPIIFQGELCGVISGLGIGCGRGYPEVFTSIKQAGTFLDRALNM